MDESSIRNIIRNRLDSNISEFHIIMDCRDFRYGQLEVQRGLSTYYFCSLYLDAAHDIAGKVFEIKKKVSGWHRKLMDITLKLRGKSKASLAMSHLIRLCRQLFLVRRAVLLQVG